MKRQILVVDRVWNRAHACRAAVMHGVQMKIWSLGMWHEAMMINELNYTRQI